MVDACDDDACPDDFAVCIHSVSGLGCCYVYPPSRLSLSATSIHRCARASCGRRLPNDNGRFCSIECRCFATDVPAAPLSSGSVQELPRSPDSVSSMDTATAASYRSPHRARKSFHPIASAVF
jgi:hypothetical protein